MGDFKRLDVWHKAHAFTLDLYQVTRRFPSSEMYGVTSQLRRAAASIGANIAEGCGRGGDGEFARFLSIATGSASELEYHLLLARDLGYMTDAEYLVLERQLREVGRMLASLSKTVAPRRLAVRRSNGLAAQ